MFSAYALKNDSSVAFRLLKKAVNLHLICQYCCFLKYAEWSTYFKAAKQLDLYIMWNTRSELNQCILRRYVSISIDEAR